MKEISTRVVQYIKSVAILQEWSESQQTLLKMLERDDPWLHALPALVCRAVGGNDSGAIPVAAAWVTLVHAGNLLDDLQDSDHARLSEFTSHITGMPISLGWIFAAFRMLHSSDLSLDQQHRISGIFAQAGFDSSLGQHRESQTTNETDEKALENYWSTVILKSGSIVMAGTASGAVMGTSEQGVIDALADYGTALGVIRQVVDDCRDMVLDENGAPNRKTLPGILQEMVKGRSPVSRKAKGLPLPGLGKAKINSTPDGAIVPELIADILLEWHRRGLASLHTLHPSKAREALEGILNSAVEQNAMTS